MGGSPRPGPGRGYPASIMPAAAPIGPIIPPSLPMVIYGVTADVSIGRLFLAGFVPGILMGVSLMVRVAFIARREGFAARGFGGLGPLWRGLRGRFRALIAPGGPLG